MLTNKRQIKKYINRVCDDVAQEVLPTAVHVKAISEEEADNILTDISVLQVKSLSRLNIAFDKSVEAFDNIKAFNSAKSAYYRQAYNKLIEDFNNEIQKLISPVNKAISSK